jgi:outer membrane biogenesis lipoprotein LolB
MRRSYLKMKTLKTAVLVVAIAALAACSSGKRQKNKADARNTDEKTKTMQQYKSCIKKAKDDQQKLDKCEMLIKAIE